MSRVKFITALTFLTTCVCFITAFALISGCDPSETLDYTMGDEATIGTHTYRAILPDDFSVFEDGQDVDVVIGTQGSMMVVAALRTNQIPWSDDPFTVTLAVKNHHGDELSRLSMRRYPTFESDGMMYFSHLYAVVNDVIGEEYGWDGQLAELLVAVQSMDGVPYLEETINLRLVATEALY